MNDGPAFTIQVFGWLISIAIGRVMFSYVNFGSSDTRFYCPTAFKAALHIRTSLALPNVDMRGDALSGIRSTLG